MKKIAFLSAFAAIAALTLSSCQKEQPLEEPALQVKSGQVPEFTVKPVIEPCIVYSGETTTLEFEIFSGVWHPLMFTFQAYVSSVYPSQNVSAALGGFGGLDVTVASGYTGPVMIRVVDPQASFMNGEPYEFSATAVQR